MSPQRNSILQTVDWAQAVTRAWWAVTLLLAFCLPLEVVTPWVSFGSTLVLTNLELIAAAALLLWLARQLVLRQFPRWRTVVTLPIVLLLTALVVASLVAPADNLHALKVTARWFIGVAVALMILNALDSGLPIGWVMRACVLGGLVVAAATWVEVWNEAAVHPLLAPFRIEYDFRVGGELRPSATLAFPTINALYLELVFFLTVGWMAVEWSRHRWRVGVLGTALGLVAGAVVLTLTRSALVAIGAAAVLVIFVRLPRLRFDVWARATLLGCVFLVLFIAVTTVLNPAQRLRLISTTDSTWYRASYRVQPLPTLRAGEMITTTIQVQNVGLVSWDSSGETPVKLSYHWFTADSSQMIPPEGVRAKLPSDVAPGASVDLVAQIQAPPREGNYILAWDMVREPLFWFSALGAPLEKVNVRILPPLHSISNLPPDNPLPLSDVTYAELDRLTLWRTAIGMLAAHPLFGVGTGNFRLRLPEYFQRTVSDKLYANNMYLELFADAGLFGGLAFLFFVFALVRLAWTGLQRTSSTTPALWLVSVIAALVTFFIHGVTDYFLEFTPAYLLFWLLVGCLVWLSPAREPS